MSAQLSEALQSNNLSRLRFLVGQHLDRIEHAEWPDLYQLYVACRRTQHNRGCALILDQIPCPGDESLRSLSVRNFLFTELLRAHLFYQQGSESAARQCLACVALIAGRTGDKDLEQIANEPSPL